MLDERGPVGLEGHLEFNAGNTVVIVFGAAADPAAGDEEHRLDRFRNGRTLKAEILRDLGGTSGVRLGMCGVAKRTEAVQINGLRHVVEEKDTKTTAK